MIKNLFAVLIAAFMAISCQDDSVRETTEALKNNSQLTSMLKDMSVNETQADNILDGTSCFKVRLPVKIIVNGYEILIASEDDYADVEIALNANNTNEDTLVFKFPIKLESFDYTEVIVRNQAELDNLKATCTEVSFNYISDKCVSLVFPITIYDYNSGFQIQDTKVITNNKELYNAVKNLDADEYYSIGYPISLKLKGGDLLKVNNNSELLAVVNSAVINCE